MFYSRKKICSIFVWVWLLVPIAMFGHSPSQSSALLVEGENGQWTLQIRGALTAFEYVVHQEYTADGYSTPEEFQELMAGVLSQNLTLSIDNERVELNDPNIKLGHETIVVYRLNLPSEFQTVEMKNSLFENIYKSKSAFMVLKNGVKRNLFNLEETNDYAAKVKIEDDAFVLQGQSEASIGISENILFIIAFFLILFAVSLVVGLKPVQVVHRKDSGQPFENQLKK
ncbi:MAG: hypothetical protein CMH46_15015 [Muricauda sp.]|nr:MULTISPECIES: hypothetical protein [unclassified Allomuricauda]MAU16837.1 hypothetical protein [Allomuricauda sp.]|tara:strand:- start:2506 stop:3186 length:681 start_codon:yes stop_codon:yes gene_type:complete